MINDQTEIILVEDNISDADLIMRGLKKNNLANNITHLTDGQQAIDYFFDAQENGEDRKEISRIILLDLKMPKVSGIEVLRKIKSNEYTKVIPIIILTSSKEDPDIAECYRLGVNSYVVKPLGFDEFIKAVSQIGMYWLMINQPVRKL